MPGSLYAHVKAYRPIFSSHIFLLMSSFHNMKLSADLLMFWPCLIHFYIWYFWITLFFASKVLVSIWLKYCVYDLRKGIWSFGILYIFHRLTIQTKYHFRNSETQYFKKAGFPETSGCCMEMVCFLVSLLSSWVLIVIPLILLQEVYLFSGRKPSKIMLHGTDTVWPNREVSRQRPGNFFFKLSHYSSCYLSSETCKIRGL